MPNALFTRRHFLSLASSMFASTSVPLPLRAADDLFRDDFAFDAPDIDRRIWTTFEGAAGFIPRTAFRNPQSYFGQGMIPLRRGAAHLALSTFNPMARRPGDSFWGSHMATCRLFQPPDRATGLEVTWSVRVPDFLPRGIVVGLFLFAPTRGQQSAHKSEIDLEVLTNLAGLANPRLLVNHYVDEPPGPGRPQIVRVPGLNLARSTNYTIRWFPWQQRIEWLVGGKLIHEVGSAVPTQPLAVHANLWAPDARFASAYDPSFQPTSTAGENMNFTVELHAIEARPVKPP